MICEICKNRTAVFHVQQIMGEDHYEMHLCRECASKKGISKDGKNFDFSLSKIISGLVKNSPLPVPSGNETEKCKTCGTRLVEVEKNGIVGCPDCYNYFRSKINRLVSINGNYVFHKGKLPAKLQAYKTILVDKESLKRDLEIAISNEEYETAVIIRDKLLNLESGFDSDES